MVYFHHNLCTSCFTSINHTGNTVICVKIFQNYFIEKIMRQKCLLCNTIFVYVYFGYMLKALNTIAQSIFAEWWKLQLRKLICFQLTVLCSVLCQVLKVKHEVSTLYIIFNSVRSSHPVGSRNASFSIIRPQKAVLRTCLLGLTKFNDNRLKLIKE